MAKKNPRKPEPQTPSLALSPSGAKSPRPLGARPPSPWRPSKRSHPRYRMPPTLAWEIYRLALEQKDAATLLRLAEALHPETFVQPRETATVRQAARPELPGA